MYLLHPSNNSSSISVEWKCKFDITKFNSNHSLNNDKCWCECENTKEENACKKA